VTWAHAEPDRLVLRVAATAPALLVLSEVWDPGWSATVDGEPASVLLADHALRAVPVPPGTYQVELRYDPPLLWLGLGISLATVGAVIVVAAMLRWREGNHAASGENG
jgi:uncharacterized membrane protein YfhO